MDACLLGMGLRRGPSPSPRVGSLVGLSSQEVSANAPPMNDSAPGPGWNRGIRFNAARGSAADASLAPRHCVRVSAPTLFHGERSWDTGGQGWNPDLQYAMGAVKKARRALRRQQVGVSARSARAGGGGSGNRTSSSFHASPGASIDAVGKLLKLHWRGIVALGLLVGISYSPALDAEFLWDDRIWTDEPVVKEWSGFSRIWLAPSEIQHEAHYWPVVYSSFWLEHKLWGLDPTGYHAVNIFLHFANCHPAVGPDAAPGGQGRLGSGCSLRGASPACRFRRLDHRAQGPAVGTVLSRSRDDLVSLRGCLPSIALLGCGRPVRAGAVFEVDCRYVAGRAVDLARMEARVPYRVRNVLRLVPFFAVAILVTAADLAFYRGGPGAALPRLFACRRGH